MQPCVERLVRWSTRLDGGNQRLCGSQILDAVDHHDFVTSSNAQDDRPTLLPVLDRDLAEVVEHDDLRIPLAVVGNQQAPVGEHDCTVLGSETPTDRVPDGLAIDKSSDSHQSGRFGGAPRTTHEAAEDRSQPVRVGLCRRWLGSCGGGLRLRSGLDWFRVGPGSERRLSPEGR